MAIWLRITIIDHFFLYLRMSTGFFSSFYFLRWVFAFFLYICSTSSSYRTCESPTLCGINLQLFPLYHSIMYHTLAKLNSLGRSLWICSHTDRTVQPLRSLVSTMGSLKSGA